MLTKKQKQALDFITERYVASGVSPSFDEIRVHLGLKSKSGVHRIILALEERAKIVRLPNRARAIAPLGAATAEAVCDARFFAGRIDAAANDYFNRKCTAKEAFHRIRAFTELMRSGMPA